MPLVRRLLITLRTLMEDDPEPPRNRRRGPNNGSRNSNRNKQTTALILTFRDLFRSGGLNIILDDMETSRRACKRSTYNSSPMKNATKNATPETISCATGQPNHVPDSSLILHTPPMTTSLKFSCLDEALPLLEEDPVSPLCTDLVPSPSPMVSRGLFGNLAIPRRKNKKPKNLTVPLNPDDENKTVETLKKVLKWSPRKQSCATFAVSIPVEEKHTALAVVENAVNRVKEEQLRKKKKKFLWLKFC